MNKEHKSVLLGILLSIGLCFFCLNSIFFYINSPSKELALIIFFSFIIQILLGIVIIICSLKLSRKAYQLFIGFTLCGWGILNLLITYKLPYDDKYWWPLYLILASIFIFIAGRIKYKKIKFGYAVPSSTLFLMGIWFALFSFKIVPISFKTVVWFLGPSFICLLGILLVLIFLVQQRHDKFVIKDDDSGDFDDEDLSFFKLD